MIGAAGLLWNLWKTRNVDCFQTKLPKDPTDVVFSLCWPENSPQSYLPSVLICPRNGFHLCTDCSFTTAIWNTIHHDVDDNHATHGHTFMSINDWWDNIIEGKSVSVRRHLSGRFLYVIWNAWKERNRRIFTGHRLTYIEVAAIVKEDIAQRQRAFAPVRVTIQAEPD
jgi:hypothetical protein